MQFHKFVQDNVASLLRSFPDQAQKQQAITTLRNSLKLLVKNQSSGIQKDLASKTRQNFLLSSDNQSLKEKNADLQAIMSKLKQEKIFIEQQKTKQRLALQQKIANLEQQKDTMKKQYQKKLAEEKFKYNKLQDSHQDKLRQLRKQTQQKILQAIQNERKVAQQMLQKQRQEFDQQKQSLVAHAKQDRSKLIKKYETKIHEIQTENQNKYDELENKMKDQMQNDSNIKQSLQAKIEGLSGNKVHLESKLREQSKNHKKYEQLYQKNKQEFDQFRGGVENSFKSLRDKIDDLSNKLLSQERERSSETRRLKKQLADTIAAKDKHYIDTVQIMNTQFRDRISTLQTTLIQQKELAINALEVKSYGQFTDQVRKYEILQKKFSQMEAFYKEEGKQVNEKINKMKKQHEDNVESLGMRLKYQLGVESKNTQRQLVQQMQKYELQIASNKREHSKELQQLVKKMHSEKLGDLNKLTGQYQAMIADIKSSQQVQLRQKVIEFERRVKGYDKKLADGQKRKTQLKLLNERTKMEMQMKVDSLIDVNKEIEEQLFHVQDKIQELENEKSRIISEYQLKIVIIKNQMQQIKDDYAVREEEMKDILDTKLQLKNKQINRLTEKLKKQTIQLIKISTEKYKHLQKQYKQLKNVVNQKTSLPEDIEALKTFHAAFTQRQQQLKKEKELRQRLQRQLKAKDSMDKIFANKGMKNTLIRQIKLASFTSHQL